MALLDTTSTTPRRSSQHRRSLFLGCIAAISIAVLAMFGSFPSLISNEWETTASISTTTTLFNNTKWTKPLTNSSESTHSKANVSHSTADGTIAIDFDAMDEETLLEHYRKRLQPHKLRLLNASTVAPHQFIHLHHMKTGGTSLDEWIRCGLSRLKHVAPDTNVPYQIIDELYADRYHTCAYGDDPTCRDTIGKASFLSYYAPFSDLGPRFHWNTQTNMAVTMLRHPVARVWSLYRYETRHCFHCKPLLQVYQDIEKEMSGEDPNAASYLQPLCRQQLLNHQTRNLLPTTPAPNTPSTEAHLAEAFRTLQSFFTIIGLTEDTSTTAAMITRVFPWLAPDLGPTWEGVLDLPQNGNVSSLQPARPPAVSCRLGHSNASPQNNKCGPNRTHWALPDHPDPEITAMIVKHNQVDLQLYDKAVALFDVQRRAMGLR